MFGKPKDPKNRMSNIGLQPVSFSIFNDPKSKL